MANAFILMGIVSLVLGALAVNTRLSFIILGVAFLVAWFLFLK